MNGEQSSKEDLYTLVAQTPFAKRIKWPDSIGPTELFELWNHANIFRGKNPKYVRERVEEEFKKRLKNCRELDTLVSLFVRSGYARHYGSAYAHPFLDHIFYRFHSIAPSEFDFWASLLGRFYRDKRRANDFLFDTCLALVETPDQAKQLYQMTHAGPKKEKVFDRLVEIAKKDHKGSHRRRQPL